MTIPTLATERLILRGPELRDAEAFVRFYTSERARFIGGPHDDGRAWRMFAAEVGHWHLMGFGMWTVTRRGDDRAIGLVGCWYPPDWPEREIGWLLWEGAEGRGYAFEAAQAARDFAFGGLGWDTAVSYIHPENAASVRLAVKLGARHDLDAAYPGGGPGLVYRHPVPDGLDGDGNVEAYA